VNAGHLLEAMIIAKKNSPGDISFTDRILDGIEMHKGLSSSLGIETPMEMERA
jgi:hypothetical protein